MQMIQRNAMVILMVQDSPEPIVNANLVSVRVKESASETWTLSKKISELFCKTHARSET